MLVVDTYNVLGVAGVLPPDLAGLDVDGLADLIRGSRHARDPALLVCDGAPPGGGWRGRRGHSTDFDDVRIAYAGPGREADDVIEQLLFDHSAARRMTVVSNDRRIQRAARKRRAGVLTSDEFLRGLASDHRRGRATPYPAFAKDIPLAQSRVSAWLKAFDVGPGFIEEIADELGFEPERVRRQVEQLRDAPAPEAAGEPESNEPASAQPETNGVADDRPEASPEREPGPIDPLLIEALEEWRGRLSLDDLDMGKWLGDADA